MHDMILLANLKKRKDRQGRFYLTGPGIEGGGKFLLFPVADQKGHYRLYMAPGEEHFPDRWAKIDTRPLKTKRAKNPPGSRAAKKARRFKPANPAVPPGKGKILEWRAEGATTRPGRREV